MKSRVRLPKQQLLNRVSRQVMGRRSCKQICLRSTRWLRIHCVDQDGLKHGQSSCLKPPELSMDHPSDLPSQLLIQDCGALQGREFNSGTWQPSRRDNSVVLRTQQPAQEVTESSPRTILFRHGYVKFSKYKRKMTETRFLLQWVSHWV